VLLCMLEAVEGRLCLLEVLGVLELLEVPKLLEVPEVMLGALLCLLEVMR
jgi:hypothetical protein